jgi:fumarate reductase subunit D
MLQRASAAVLALCVLVHLVTIIYAVQGGFSCTFGRTRGNYGWAAFYSVFVLACAVHVPIGLRAVPRNGCVARPIAGRGAGRVCRGHCSNRHARRDRSVRMRGHPGSWAALVHRVSGVALALFLPIHFWALAHALQGEAKFEGFLRWADSPLVKFAEWGLVVLLAAHLAGGLRVLALESAVARLAQGPAAPRPVAWRSVRVRARCRIAARGGK